MFMRGSQLHSSIIFVLINIQKISLEQFVIQSSIYFDRQKHFINALSICVEKNPVPENQILYRKCTFCICTEGIYKCTRGIC